MLTADERLALICVKVERAKKHIRELEGEINTFLESNPYVVGTKPDAHYPDAYLIYYIVSAIDPPLMLAAITGDVIQNLRTALDHLACNLVEVGRGIITRDTGFPIINTTSPAEYKTARRIKVKGMTQDAKDAIDATKPYKGGNDALWRLHSLNNIDKHRILVTVGSSISAHNVPQSLRRPIYEAVIKAQKDMPPDWVRFPADNALDGMTLRPPDRKCPLKTGDELSLALRPVPKTDDKVQITFEIAFGEPGIVESEPLLPTLVGMADRVNDLITSFRPLLV